MAYLKRRKLAVYSQFLIIAPVLSWIAHQVMIPQLDISEVLVLVQEKNFGCNTESNSEFVSDIS